MPQAPPYRIDLCRPDVSPALTRWARSVLCVLFALTIVLQFAPDTNAQTQVVYAASIYASADGSESLDHHAGTIGHCDHFAGCSVTIIGSDGQSIVFDDATTYRLMSDILPASDTHNRRFRPPQLPIHA